MTLITAHQARVKGNRREWREGNEEDENYTYAIALLNTDFYR